MTCSSFWKLPEAALLSPPLDAHPVARHTSQQSAAQDHAVSSISYLNSGLLVGPVASLLLITGNVSVILGLFPAHVTWTVHTIVKTPQLDTVLRALLLVILPIVAVLWLAISIVGSLLVAVGYGFFAPWVSTFEAFRHRSESSKFIHCITDGTWSTIKGSCTVVRDFLDLSYHTYPSCLKDIRQKCSSASRPYDIKLEKVPACFVVGLLGLLVEVPFFTILSICKSPYMLLRGWQRFLHDVISREGCFFETACVPIAGLVILLWPLVVIASTLLAIFSSFFVGLYGAVVVYQESSFRRGVAYVVAMVAEFDEYTNDFLYLREGSCFPRPNYRKKMVSKSTELPGKVGHLSEGSTHEHSPQTGGLIATAPGMIMPTLLASRSVRETIQEVKMVQIWEDSMKCLEMAGRELIDANVVTIGDLDEWTRSSKSAESTIIGVGLPSYSLLHSLVCSVRAGTVGLLMANGVEVTYLNRPEDRFLDWFFHPIMVLKDQIQAAQMKESELRFLEKLTLMTNNPERMKTWENGAIVPDDALRNGELQAISRRLQGITRSISKFPTHRRRYQQVVKALISYAQEKDGSSKTRTVKSSSTRGSRKDDSMRYSRRVENFPSVEIASAV